jgi:hypothetical protein
MDPQWKHPFTALICGPTGCGKSHFVTRFIQHLPALVNTPITEVVWCYSEWQDLYEANKNSIVRFHQGLPQLEDFPSNEGARLVIIDDMMREADERVVDLFTKGSHHRNLSIMFISQNMFHQGKGRRDISLNSHYLVCFKNPRDRAQIGHLSRQVYPDNPLFVRESFEDATSAPHGYLLFDFKQSTLDIMRFRTAIFPDDKSCFVYLPKTSIKHQVAPHSSSFVHHV